MNSGICGAHFFGVHKEDVPYDCEVAEQSLRGSRSNVKEGVRRIQ